MKRKHLWLLAPVILLVIFGFLESFKQQAFEQVRQRVESEVVGKWKSVGNNPLVTLQFDKVGNAVVTRGSNWRTNRRFAMRYQVIDGSHIKFEDKFSSDKFVWQVKTTRNELMIVSEPGQPASKFERVKQ
jgi:hypothetical protein